MDRQVGRTRERRLTQILGVHHQHLETTSERKPGIPKVGAAAALGRLRPAPHGSRRGNTSGATAEGLGRGDPLGGSVQPSLAHSDGGSSSGMSRCSSSGSSGYSEDEVQTFADLGFAGIAHQHQSQQKQVPQDSRRRMTMVQAALLVNWGTCAADQSMDLGSMIASFSRRRNQEAAAARKINFSLGDGEEALAADVGGSAGGGGGSDARGGDASHAAAATAGAGAAVAGAKVATPRVQLRVEANRPFSAPRAMRWGAAEPPPSSVRAARPHTSLRPTATAAAAAGAASVTSSVDAPLPGIVGQPQRQPPPPPLNARTGGAFATAATATTSSGGSAGAKQPGNGGRRAELTRMLRPASAFTSPQRQQHQHRSKALEAAAPKSQYAAAAEGLLWEPQARWMTQGAC